LSFVSQAPGLHLPVAHDDSPMLVSPAGDTRKFALSGFFLPKLNATESSRWHSDPLTFTRLGTSLAAMMIVETGGSGAGEVKKVPRAAPLAPSQGCL